MAKKAAEVVCENPLGPELFRFLKDLKGHNDREWFQANKARYETEARNPVLQLIGGFEGPLAAISRHFNADPRPMGGSLFRIYRDTRFSKDKTPYKTHLGVNFRHRAEGAGGVHGPGFYLHLEPGECFAGGGLWHPDPEALFKVSRAFTNADVLAPDFPQRLAEACREAAPLVAFLCKALELPF